MNSEGTKTLEPTGSPSPTSPVSTEQTVSPTPTPASSSGQVTQKDLLISGVIGLLVIMIVYQCWPKIKQWLHKKTNG
jgi:hypothetical protein